MPTDREAIKQALVNLVTKIDEVFAHDSYRGVWVMAHVHGYTYNGPTFEAELNAAKAALLPCETEPPRRTRPKSSWELRAEAAERRASTLEDAAFHFQTCRTCAEDGEDNCESGKRFAAFLRGELDGD
jgi:hypothetical protein